MRANPKALTNVEGGKFDCALQSFDDLIDPIFNFFMQFTDQIFLPSNF